MCSIGIRALSSSRSIYDLVPPQFASGRVTLIGNAAAAARPHVGYGTTKAAGDAPSAREQQLETGSRRIRPRGSRIASTPTGTISASDASIADSSWGRGYPGSTADGSGTGGYAVFGYRRWHPAPRCKRRISSDVGNVGRTAAVSRGEGCLVWVETSLCGQPEVEFASK